MKVSFVLLACLIEDARADFLSAEGDSLWFGHKARHIDEFLLDLIEGRRDLIGSNWRLILLFYLFQRLVESVLCRLHEIVGYFDPFVQRLEVWDFRIVSSWPWYIWVLWPFDENFWKRPFFFRYLLEIFLLLNLSLFFFGWTCWLDISNVATGTRS